SAGHDPVLIVASILVAIMASFTGLRMASGLSLIAPAERRPRIAKAAIALGGGIWSMHFIAMLAMVLDVPITYAALPTLGSVLVAILMTGVGLIVLHFGERDQLRIVIAGTLAGLGIVSMHYLGMSAITGELSVSYRAEGVALSMLIAIVSSIFAFELAYRRRTLPTLTFGAVAFGLAVASMHYTAMAFTRFELSESTGSVEPLLSSGLLALIVAVASFVICGLFLLMAIPIEAVSEGRAGPVLEGTEGANSSPATAMAASQPPQGHALFSKAADAGPRRQGAFANRIPYERDKTIRFLSADQIAAIRAEGHYSRVINGNGEFFCPWPISRVAEAVGVGEFIRTHRSYLVNLSHVSGFRREGDKAFCFVNNSDDLRIPVSRSRISDVQHALGLS
ncbi:MAG TPA: MHYT domain-containing protein, partial [Afifellaceae bacterium]|nr:MHYT domain-containing protein [Afifellaceae bacterium]